MSRKLVNVFENREMRFGFLVLCFALMGHRNIDYDITCMSLSLPFNPWSNWPLLKMLMQTLCFKNGLG
jgi:hypothetical protein